MEDEHTYSKKMARNGPTTVIYKGTFVSNHSLLTIHCVIYFVCLFLLTFAYFNLNHLLLFFRVKEGENRNETVAKMPFRLRPAEA